MEVRRERERDFRFWGVMSENFKREGKERELKR
jgi:hypothetical protein